MIEKEYNKNMKTIILLHGAWVTPKSWDPFKSYFEAKGYRVLAPAWPGKEHTVEEQQKNPDPSLAKLGLKEIVDYYAKIIEAEPEPPILIGHSFGGLFVEMLLDRGLGKAGIAIDPAPPKGVFALYPTAAWALRLPLTTAFGWKKIIRWPLHHFAYAFTNTLSPEEQEKAYREYVVPESGRIFWQAAFAPFNNVLNVNFQNPNRAPLLIIAGEKDHIVPAAINRANFKKYQASSAKTDFKEFPGRTHWIIAEPGWEEVAKSCENWIRVNA
jgi:pimeloyl-ACP methyl ester carboxylesterase